MALLLVIDEDAELRRLYRIILESADHQVLDCSCEAEAIALHEQQSADLILFDVPDPTSQKQQPLAQLRSRWPQVKVLVLSAGMNHLGQNTLLRLKEQWGVTEVLAKPFAIVAFLAQIAAALQPKS